MIVLARNAPAHERNKQTRRASAQTGEMMSCDLEYQTSSQYADRFRILVVQKIG